MSAKPHQQTNEWCRISQLYTWISTIKLMETNWAICLNIYFFVLFFCLLLHRLAVRISLPFYIFHPRQSWIPDSLSVKLRSQAPMGSLSNIPESKTQDSGFHEQKFLWFRNPDSITWGDFLVLKIPILNQSLRLEFGHIRKAWRLDSLLWSNVVNDGTKEPGKVPILGTGHYSSPGGGGRRRILGGG